MAGQMICKRCECFLHSLDIIHEQRYSLASVFSVNVICSKCSRRDTVTSNKRQKVRRNRLLFITRQPLVSVTSYFLFLILSR